MKRSPLKRKAPLKAKKGFNNSPFTSTGEFRGYSTFKTKSFEELISTSKQKVQSIKSTRADNVKPPAPKKRNSMKGAGRTTADIQFHAEIVALGCIACSILGRKPNHPLQIHHPEGRNKCRAGDCSEQYALCLCCEHHDQRIYKGQYSGGSFIPVSPDEPSIHHSKKAFLEKFGTEQLLVHLTYLRLGKTPPWMTGDEWSTFCRFKNNNEQSEYLVDVMRSGLNGARRAIALES